MTGCPLQQHQVEAEAGPMPFIAIPYLISINFKSYAGRQGGPFHAVSRCAYMSKVDGIIRAVRSAQWAAPRSRRGQKQKGNVASKDREGIQQPHTGNQKRCTRTRGALEIAEIRRYAGQSLRRYTPHYGSGHTCSTISWPLFVAVVSSPSPQLLGSPYWSPSL